jgi:hypothetical protein
MFKPVLDTLLEIPGKRYPEQKMALNKDGKAAEYNKDYWVRGIVDLMIVDGDTAFIVDYKTGSNKYPEPKQLKLMALMAFARHPELMRIKAGLLFIVHNSFMTEEYTRDQIPQLWEAFKTDLKRMEVSYESDVWNMNPTQLCGWCPVNTCPHHTVRR